MTQQINNHDEIIAATTLTAPTTSTTALKQQATSTSSTTRRHNSCGSHLKSYAAHLISSALFFVYCSVRSILVYDTFVAYKLTHDLVLLVSLVLETVFVLVWLVSLMLIITHNGGSNNNSKHSKNMWSFDLHSTYRVMYWNKVYDEKRKSQQQQQRVVSGYYGRSSTSSSSGGSSGNQHGRPLNHHHRVEDVTKTSEINDGYLKLRFLI